MVSPERSPGGQRWYTEADVPRLRLLAREVEAGRSISTIAALSAEALAKVVRSEEASIVARGTRFALAGQPHLAEAMGAVETLDGSALDATLRQAALRLSMDELLDGVIAPLVKVVGDRWHSGQLSPAHEHLTTAVIRRLLGWLTEQYAPAADAPALLVTTPAGQMHELGASLAAATAAAGGWRVVYLGPNLPASDIASACRTCGARAVALSIVFPDSDPLMDGELQALRAALRDDVRIVAGGGAVAAYRPILDAIGATVVTDLPSLRGWLQMAAASEAGSPGR